ncbi:MAG: FtsX-like permease family protein, partial [Bacteroidota bacterium]
QPRDEALMVRHLDIDPHYLETYGIRLEAGRNFRVSDYSPRWEDLSKIIINRTLMEQLGFEQPQEAIGQPVTFSNKEWQVIGVTDNFHQVGLQSRIEPIMLRPLYSTGGYFSIRMRSQQAQTVLAQVEQTFAEFFPGNAFNYQFVADSYRAQYLNEQRTGQLFGGFAGLALLIACLGLLGLAVYSAVQRSKEIGIRKVLGATLPNLLTLLGRELVTLVLLASLISLPLTAWLMDRWLQDFAYRVEQSIWVLALPALLVLLLAMASVAYQIWQTATVNPVQALRDE